MDKRKKKKSTFSDEIRNMFGASNDSKLDLIKQQQQKTRQKKKKSQ